MITAEDFLRNLRESGLSCSGGVPVPAGPAPDGLVLAREFVAAKLLTPYQAVAVLNRRFGELQIGNYDILDRLGAGGMGTVYKARHRLMKRIVALKVLSQAIAKQASAVRRFRREIETIARLNHPNVVMAYDADVAEQGPFLVMEFIEGRDLAWVVGRHGPLAVADAVDAILQAARGLVYAHEVGIIHRDIKPANLIRDTSGVVKITDLGIARFHATEGPTDRTTLTQAGTIVGTVDYMAPEQAVDSTLVDHRSDIYALGCTLYFLMTGVPPYQSGSPLGVLVEHRDAPIPSLRAKRPEIPQEVENCYRRMVAKAPEERHAHMSDVVRELERISASLPRSTAAASLRARVDTLTDVPAVTLVMGPGGQAVVQETGEFVLSTPRPVAEALAGRTVVVAQPSRTQAAIITRQLQQLGIEGVRITSTGRETIANVKQCRTAIVIASMQLPDMTGVELVGSVLSDVACAGASIVLTTSKDDPRSAEAIPASPRVTVLQKPFDEQQLAHAITSVIGSSGGFQGTTET